MPDQIVCMNNVQRYYGDRPDLVEENRRIEESGKCPFCPDGIKDKGFVIIGETSGWTLVLNQFPYKGSTAHILVVPKRHIVSSLDLKTSEWVQWQEIMDIAVTKYPFLKNGFGIAMREKELGGVTLYHLHFHLIVPKANTESFAEVPVNFRIG